jgi:hypothetical protein
MDPLDAIILSLSIGILGAEFIVWLTAIIKEKYQK